VPEVIRQFGAVPVPWWVLLATVVAIAIYTIVLWCLNTKLVAQAREIADTYTDFKLNTQQARKALRFLTGIASETTDRNAYLYASLADFDFEVTDEGALAAVKITVTTPSGKKSALVLQMSGDDLSEVTLVTGMTRLLNRVAGKRQSLRVIHGIDESGLDAHSMTTLDGELLKLANLSS